MGRKEGKEKEAQCQEATAALQTWNQERAQNTSKKCQSNRADEATMEQTRDQALAPGSNPWELVANLIDTNAHAGDDVRDTSRMRSLLIQLKTSAVTSAA